MTACHLSSTNLKLHGVAWNYSCNTRGSHSPNYMTKGEVK